VLRFLLVVFIITLFGACSGPSSPTPPTAACRNYASSVNVSATFTATPLPPDHPSYSTTKTTSGMASYNTVTNQLTGDTDITAFPLNCLAQRSGSKRYNSVADFIDEVSVIPPRTRSIDETGTVTYSDGLFCSAGTSSYRTTHRYDSQGRLVQTVDTGGTIFITMTYSAWDSVGLP
jgi:hypothetical protein